MKLEDLPTPCLVLDRMVLQRNVTTMAETLARHGVPLRPHMKTAKSIDAARIAVQGQPGGITVSTLAEAEYFAGHGMLDMLYAVGITPQKLEEIAKLNAVGADVIVVVDDPIVAEAIAASPVTIRALIEIDTGERRGGIQPEDVRLLQIAAKLGSSLAGVMTHAGHSYAGRTPDDMRRIAEMERAGITRAAARLREAGYDCPIVSMGSTPTAQHAERLTGVTEVRAGVFMFGDLFQMEIGSNGLDSIALTVLASVIGRRPEEHRLLIDAGALALSKDRSTQDTTADYGFGLVVDVTGAPAYGGAVVRRAYQEHGLVDCDPGQPFPELPIGAKVRVMPNHACLTAAGHDRYHVVDGGDEVAAVWTRVNGW